MSLEHRYELYTEFFFKKMRCPPYVGYESFLVDHIPMAATLLWRGPTAGSEGTEEDSSTRKSEYRSEKWRFSSANELYIWYEGETEAVERSRKDLQ